MLILLIFVASVIAVTIAFCAACLGLFIDIIPWLLVFAIAWWLLTMFLL